MGKKTKRSSTTIFLIFLMSLILTPISQASFTQEWGEFQDDPTNRGFVHDETGIWNATGTLTTITDGIGFQPLAADIDSDGTIELIGYDGNFLKIWTVTNSVLTLEDEHNFGGTQNATMTLFNIDGDNFTEIIGVFNSNITVIEYNGTGIGINQTNATVNATRTGIRCGNFSGTIGCYWGSNNGDVVEYNPVTSGMFEYNVSDSDIFTTAHGATNSPAMADLDRDGNQELIFICDFVVDNDEGICVWDQSSTALDTGFSADGVLEIVDAGGTISISGTTIRNLDGAGDDEILITYYRRLAAATDEGFLRGFNSDGSAYGSTVQVIDDNVGGGQTTVTPPIIASVNTTATEEICVIGEQSFINECEISCYDNTLTNELYSWTGTTTCISEGVHVTMTAADMDGDGNDELITGSSIIDFTTASAISAINYSVSMNSFPDSIPILIDIDQDNNLDVCAQQANQVFCALSDSGNQPPTINNSLRFGGYGTNMGFSTPVCINTTVTFSAQESGGAIAGNYDNDLSTDTERLVTNCGQLPSGFANPSFTNNRQNGSFEGSSPSYSCFFNHSGTYNVRIYLQDDANPSDFSQFNTETIVTNVIAGTAGSTCNIVSPVLPGTLTVAVEIPGQDEFEESAETVVNMLTGSNATVKLWIGMVLLGLLMVGMYMLTKSFGIALLATVIGVVFGSFLTFFPIWLAIVVIILVIGVAIIALSLGFTNNNNNSS